MERVYIAHKVLGSGKTLTTEGTEEHRGSSQLQMDEPVLGLQFVVSDFR
jgi:hypothetical protein